jgi:protein tyrosine phosphatase (PTP) superfamily phosphohydrolase (DUF442 family)
MPPVDYRADSGAVPDMVWHAAPESKRTAPEAPHAEAPREPVHLSTPEATPPQSAEPPKSAETDRMQRGSLPVGIPQFTMVRDQLAAGLRPLVDGGLDWLQANGYHAVLHLRVPGQDDEADRRQVEKHGMKYVGLEVSPQTLTPAVVDMFNRVVGERSNYPLFVYDKDGKLAGGLWYLHFRIVDRDSDAIARNKAARLGLKEDETGEQREMWLAIQKLLSITER